MKLLKEEVKVMRYNKPEPPFAQVLYSIKLFPEVFGWP